MSQFRLPYGRETWMLELCQLTRHFFQVAKINMVTFSIPIFDGIAQRIM